MIKKIVIAFFIFIFLFIIFIGVMLIPIEKTIYNKTETTSGFGSPYYYFTTRRGLVSGTLQANKSFNYYVATTQSCEALAQFNNAKRNVNEGYINWTMRENATRKEYIPVEVVEYEKIQSSFEFIDYHPGKYCLFVERNHVPDELILDIVIKEKRRLFQKFLK